MNAKRKLPPWLKRRLPANPAYEHTHHVLSTLGLETICTNANCPNRGQCWEKGTATVLILGNICTRNCGFCSVTTGKPKPLDPSESDRVAEMAQQMKIKYLVITSVDRDDLPDGGAAHFRDVINHCRQKIPAIEFELLVPDFRDCQDKALETLSAALPFVFGHNIETVPTLYKKVRPGGNYELSLTLLKKAKQKYNLTTKSSIMLGLGETQDQVIQTLSDLRNADCDRIAIGQYLRPTKNSIEVSEYVHPEKFQWWKQKAKDMGFKWIMASPFTRSSFNAEQKNTK